MYKILKAETLAAKIHLMVVHAPRVASHCQPGQFIIANLKTAGSAHTCSINHDRVHADNCMDAEFLGKQTDKFHHDHRSDRNTDIVMLAFVCDKVFQSLCYHTGTAIGTVVCCNIKVGNSRR